jgi:hypothetical protein
MATGLTGTVATIRAGNAGLVGHDPSLFVVPLAR